MWAFTTFQPEAPFRLETESGLLKSYGSAADVARAIKEGELAQEPRFPLKAKLRPVVLLQDHPRGVLREFAALKLARFTKLPEPDQQRIRNGQERALFYLRVDKSKYGLKQENAVDLNSLVRVHESAILARAGRLDANEVDVLGRLVAEFLDIDLEPAIREGVLARWDALVAAQKEQPGP